MRTRAGSIAAICIAVLLGAACTSTIPTHNIDFFQPPLGSAASSLPAEVRPMTDCSISEAHIDCEFVDEDGVQYLVFADTVTRKRIDLRTHPNARLPFGLSRDDLQPEVLAALQRQTRLRLLPAAEANVFAATAPSSDGVEVTLYAVFERSGRLAEIGVTAGEAG